MKNAPDRVTAAAVLIGNELLSGSVADKNMHYIACKLVEAGIVLVEVRVIPDDCEMIASTVREMRGKVDYVFTTGGIGPTHDDITAECIAKSFDRPLIQHPETAKTLRVFFAEKGVEANPERMRMANMPEGAEPLKHKGSAVPGFRMENVFVLAGVPSIMQSMLDAAVPGLRSGKPVLSQTVRCDLSEGALAHGLKLIQEAVAEDVDIGSYPLSRDEHFHVRLVIRGTNSEINDRVREEIETLIGSLGGNIIPE